MDCKTSENLGGHHFENHHGDLKSYVCDGCGLSFSRKNNITKHKKTGACKGFFQQDEEQAENETNKFTCHKCHKTFKYRQSYTQHMEWIHLGQKKQQCEDCGQTFAQLAHLRRHRVKVHDHVMPHLCTFCDSRFVSMIQWKTHLKRYHDVDVEPNANIITDETVDNDNTANNEILEDTKKITSKETNVGIISSAASKSCPAADCKFQTHIISELNDHIDAVHDSRPYKCRKCGTAFKKSYHLKAHDTEVHIGIRPHVCETCGFSFARYVFTSLL